MKEFLAAMAILQVGALIGGILVSVAKNKDRALGAITLVFIAEMLLLAGGVFLK